MSKKNPTDLQRQIIRHAIECGKKGFTMPELTKSAGCSSERVRETRIEFAFTKGRCKRNGANIWFATDERFSEYV